MGLLVTQLFDLNQYVLPDSRAKQSVQSGVS
jgi:hypothetical protein